MPTRDQVLALLRGGRSYESAGRALRIPAGQAFMIATGLPADSGDVQGPEAQVDGPLPAGGAQALVNPAAVNPTRDPVVTEWVRARAARELDRPR